MVLLTPRTRDPTCCSHQGAVSSTRLRPPTLLSLQTVGPGSPDRLTTVRPGRAAEAVHTVVQPSPAGRRTCQTKGLVALPPLESWPNITDRPRTSERHRGNGSTPSGHHHRRRATSRRPHSSRKRDRRSGGTGVVGVAQLGLLRARGYRLAVISLGGPGGPWSQWSALRRRP